MINLLLEKWRKLDTRIKDFIIASLIFLVVSKYSSTVSKPIFPTSSQFHVLILLPIVFIELVVYWNMFKLFVNELMHVWLILFPPSNFKYLSKIDKDQKAIISQYLDEIRSNFDRRDHQFVLACIIDKSPISRELRYSKYSRLIKSEYLPMFYKIYRDRLELAGNDVKITSRVTEHKILSKDFWMNFNILNREEFEEDLISSPETEYTYIRSSDRHTIAIGFYLKLSLEFDGYRGEEIRRIRETIARETIRSTKDIINQMINKIDEMIHDK